MSGYTYLTNGGGGGGGGSSDEEEDATTEQTQTERESSTSGGTSSSTTFTSGSTSGTSYSFSDSGGSDTGGAGGTSAETQLTSGTGEASAGPAPTSSSEPSGSTSEPDTTQTQAERESSEHGGTAGADQFTAGTGPDLGERTGAGEVAEAATDTTLQEGVERSGDARTRSRARDLERRAVDELDWARSADDVAVVEEDGRLVANPSRSAEVRHRKSRLLDGARNMTSPQQDARGSGPTGASLDPGAGQSLPAVSATAADPGDVRFGFEEESGDVTVRLAENETEEQLRRNAAMRHGVDPEDVVITERTENGRTVVEARPSREALREKAEERVEEQFGTDFDPDEDLEFEETAGGGMGVSLTTSGRAKAQKAEETLGDADALVGEEAEQFLREQSLAHQDRVTGMSERLGGELEGLGVPGHLADRQSAAATGVFRFLDPAGLALTAEEAGEYAHEAVDRGPRGADELAVETAGVAAEGVDEFMTSWEQDPHGTTGELAGGLIASTAVMGGAAAVSGRSGAAARLAIQPGEEIAGQAGHAVTRAATSARTADRLFPDKEPLVFSEEFAIRATRAAGQRASSAGRATLTVARGEAELPPSPHQRALIDAGRPEGPAETLGGEGSGHYAGPSEPLGSDTEAALDAATSIEPEQPGGEPVSPGGEWVEVPLEEDEGSVWAPSPEMRRVIAEAGEEQEERRWLRRGDIGFDAERGEFVTGGGRTMLGPELDARTMPATFGSEVTSEEQSRLERAQTPGVSMGRGAELEARREQFSDWGHDIGFETEAGARSRLETAQRPEARTETETERKLEAPWDLGTGFEVGFRGSSVGIGLGLGVEARSALDQEMESELSQEAETRQRLEGESELESESELEFESEAEAERGARRRPEEDREREDNAMLPGFGAEADDEAAIGWVGESIGAFAGVNLGAAASRTPESELEDADHPFGEAVPGLTEDEREAFDSALDFFGLDNTEGDWL